MQFTLIRVEKLFPTGAYANEKLIAEVSINAGENPLDAFGAARKLIDEDFARSNPHLVTPDIPAVTKRIIVPAASPHHSNKEIESTLTLEDQIKSCVDLKILESYKFIVKTKPELQKTYDKLHKKLSNGK